MSSSIRRPKAALVTSTPVKLPAFKRGVSSLTREALPLGEWFFSLRHQLFHLAHLRDHIAEFMDPLSIAASVAGLLQAISAACATISKISNLPKAFEHVKKHLPLAQRTLEDIRVQLEHQSLTEAEQQTIAQIIQGCAVKAGILRQIFDTLEEKCKQDKDARSWDKVRGWYHEALRGIKGHRVESLMNDILEDLRNLGLYQVFRLATQEDVAEIKKALQDFSHVEPSLDDATVESGSVIHASQSVNTGGMGQQNNPSGGTNTFNSGYNISGGTVTFGEAP